MRAILSQSLATSEFQYSQLSRVVWKFKDAKLLCANFTFQYSQLSRVVWKEIVDSDFDYCFLCFSTLS